MWRIKNSTDSIYFEFPPRLKVKNKKNKIKGGIKMGKEIKKGWLNDVKCCN